MLCSGESFTRGPLHLGLPDCGTEANELVLLRSCPVFEILLEKQEIGLSELEDHCGLPSGIVKASLFLP